MERTPSSIAELRDITAEMPFNKMQDYLDGFSDEFIRKHTPALFEQ